jgi:hypothetical protein
MADGVARHAVLVVVAGGSEAPVAGVVFEYQS